MESSCRLRIRTAGRFVGSHSTSRYRFPSCTPHCSTCVALTVRRAMIDDLTSSLTFLRFVTGSSFEFPALPVGNKGQGLRSLRDLTQHLTTRADDSHAAPVCRFPSCTPISKRFLRCQGQVGSLRCFELNHMLHRLCGPPPIHLSFNLAAVLPRRSIYRVSCGTQTEVQAPNRHRLRRGLPGYLILFAPHAFAPQRQYLPRRLLRLLVFFQISTHSTATPEIPSPSAIL